MSEEINKAFQEVYTVIQLLDKSIVEKLPERVINFIEMQRDKKYKVNINPDIAIEEQNLLTDTYNILAILKIKYWCRNNKEKQRLLNIININEARYEEWINNQYNTNDIFKKKDDETDSIYQGNNYLVEIKKEKWYKRIFSIIKNIFKKH